MIETLAIHYFKKDNISDEEIKFINKINPRMLKIHGDVWTVQNIKALGLVNCTNINIKFNIKTMLSFHFWFINTPILLVDSNSDQRRTYEWESIKFIIFQNKIKNLKLIKANNENFLFIKLDTIKYILFSGFREILSAYDVNKQFPKLVVKHQFKGNGFVVPMRYSNKIFIELGDDDLDHFYQIKDIYKILNLVLLIKITKKSF